MEIFPNGPGSSPRILLLGGTSEIGLAILSALAAPAQTQVILAGRDEQRLAAAGKQLPYQVRTHGYDATETGAHQAFADAIFAEGPLDMVVSAAGILVPQQEVERDVRRAAEMVETNFTGHVTSLLGHAYRRAPAAAAPSWCSPRSRRSARARPTSSTGRPRPAWTPSPAG
jgi:decaprenylphospho-beta-D-erythro-pentofuranosid-2-ulose 2-reductase